MIKRYLTFLILAIAALLTIQTEAMAAAVPDELHISLWPEYNDNQIMFMEGVRYSESTPLPIEVKMAVPKGASVIWTGDLMGGDAAQDVAATPKVNPMPDYDEVVFTLTKSRTGQLEAQWPALKVNGQEREINLEWTQRYEAKRVTFDLRVPTQATDIKMSPPASTTGVIMTQQEFIDVAPLNLAVGQKQDFNITYKRSTNVPSVTEQPTQQPQGGTISNSSSGWSSGSILILFAIAVALILAAVAFARSNKHRTSEQESRDNQGTASDQRKPSAKKSGSVQKPSADTQSAVETYKKPAVVLLIAAVVIGAVVINALMNSSNVPSGDNCTENTAYLQAGVDRYKDAFGEYPTDLKQLLETRDGKGPFVETISLQCPTDGVPYTVINGKVEQAPPGS